MEEDPVVKEIPVFLSKTLQDKLYLVQYPLLPMRDGSENFTVLKSSFKPENQELQLELEVDVENNNYDQIKGAQFILNAKNESKKNESIYDSDLLDKTILSSAQSVVDCTNYAIGIFQNEEFHITPVKGILEMRPQFDYLEKGDKRAKDETKASGEDSNDEEENAAPVKVTFARHQSDHVKKFQEQSFQFNSKKKPECCIQTTYIPMHAPEAHLTRIQMFCPSRDMMVHSLNLSPQEYLDLLIPPRSQHSMTFLEQVKMLPLEEQVRILMKKSGILSFKNLRSMISDHNVTDALNYVQKAAVLVQGNWIVKSELIYPKDFTSSQNGIPGEVMCRARDYILLCFTERPYIKRDQLSTFVKVPLAEVNEILEVIATKEFKEGWKLMLPPDWEFCKRFPEQTERQRIFWDARRKYLTESHAPPRQRRKSSRESLGSENEERNVGRGRKSHRDSSLSDNDGTVEPVKPKKTSSRKNSETTTT
ncbi:PREDICTED: DNA-directed RNA polymerase III subunit RPC5 [Dinoponera quadriceps]|uniref:DNA-directed RNA polymerase III subunit RPC5 n=1 Tax=Dinoponera quadriceps TaxID=609295 RepID=A0A6P3WPS2_DINQU|nr:PREDICTED: DNA-directed RNA polymerase III subunit RPC5 [Dinoponera quadriceps]